MMGYDQIIPYNVFKKILYKYLGDPDLVFDKHNDGSIDFEIKDLNGNTLIFLLCKQLMITPANNMFYHTLRRYYSILDKINITYDYVLISYEDNNNFGESLLSMALKNNNNIDVDTMEHLIYNGSNFGRLHDLINLSKYKNDIISLILELNIKHFTQDENGDDDDDYHYINDKDENGDTIFHFILKKLIDSNLSDGENAKLVKYFNIIYYSHTFFNIHIENNNNLTVFNIIDNFKENNKYINDIYYILKEEYEHMDEYEDMKE
jgi:hypothetical protein